jgi:hypothetical protein
MQLRPDQNNLELLSQLEQSARAEVRLRRKALDWANQQNSRRRAPQQQPGNPVSPTSPGTSDSIFSEPPKT